MDDVWFSLEFIKKNFNAELLFTDTDSLTYEIKSEICLTLVFIQKIQSFLMILIKMLLAK